MTRQQLDVEHPSMDWIDRYRNLAEMGNRLKTECPELTVMALSTVNPRHPLPAGQMSLLDENPRRFSPSLLGLARGFTRCLIAAFRDTIESVYLRLRVRSAYGERKAPVSVIIKTWCFDGPPRGDAPDFYYGSLPARLAKRGIGCVVLWDDNRESPFPSARQDPESPYVAELGLIPLWAPLWTLWTQVRSVRAIRRLSRSADDPEFSRFCDVAGIESLSPLTLRNTLMYYVAKTAVERWRPKAFLTLYEGQPWESVARQGVKTADPGCLNVAYQHTTVFPHSLTVTDPSPTPGEQTVPDVVLSTGEVTAEIIRPGHEEFRSTVVQFGSYRRTSDQRLEAPEPGLRTVLVLPEGFLAESKILFDFALGAASLLPDYRFVFRCHPTFGFERVRAHLREDPDAYGNVELSEGETIDADFDRSSVLLYRGTSAVLYGLLAGLKPYYVDIEGSPMVDALFRLTGWRESTSGQEDFCEKVRNYGTTSPVEAEREWEAAARYVDRYSSAVTEESVDRFVEAVGLT